MKRRNLLAHLHKHGCLFHHEGAKHTVYYRPTTGKQATIPRHNEIEPFLAKKICDQLEIRPPSQK